ncbi:hypothetical protein HMPREF9080_01046 [Cardiobacterium valvarum F0432]|uniref:Uncharacterized protein n=1 Tax=Cardiobacterium valvarum F0432 TaxID=797473 RepID=G9ZE62_9GAMM|nr:hypothetical protein HMPREF9080_01046 [Cardiobacterium valvarum F0432]
MRRALYASAPSRHGAYPNRNAVNLAVVETNRVFAHFPRYSLFFHRLTQ